MERVVGMGEYIVTDRKEDVLRTFALASCVAVTAYDPERKAAGMIHVVLPTPIRQGDEVNRPAYYASTGVPLMITTLCRGYGCRKEELRIQMYGGADSTLQQDIFSIGKKNIDAVKRSLLGMGLTIQKADLRGSASRTLAMNTNTGLVEVFRQPMGK
ncbi:MAG: chemotaxis protein CheD [Clostridiaceae bacterium]|nr:chemotaxis protein CheD [Clostridiaceae bacterium]